MGGHEKELSTDICHECDIPYYYKDSAHVEDLDFTGLLIDCKASIDASRLPLSISSPIFMPGIENYEVGLYQLTVSRSKHSARL